MNRTTVAGLMSPTSITLAKKTLTSPNMYRYATVQNKDTISVHSENAAAEQRSSSVQNSPIYHDKVNVLSVINATSEVMYCKYTENTKEIAVGFSDGFCRLYDCMKGNCSHVLVDDEMRNFPGPVTCIKHRPVSNAYPCTNMFLTSYVNGCIKCWQYKYDECLYTIREKRMTHGLCYHPRLTKFVSYGDDSKIHLYDEETQTQERSFYASDLMDVVDGHSSRIYAVSFNPRSSHELVSGGWDDRVFCWDDRQPHATKYLDGPHVCGEALEFSHCGKQLLTCSWSDDNSIQLWDYGSCRLIETVVPDDTTSRLYCGKLVHDTEFMVCGGSDENMLRLVNMATGKSESWVRNHGSGVRCFDLGRVRRRARNDESDARTLAMHDVPRVAYCCGQTLYQVDFGDR